VEPDRDASPDGDGFAYLTEAHVPGTHVSLSDVDGRTSFRSPVFDLKGLTSTRLAYHRWFSNRAPMPDADEFRVDVSNDGGASWVNAETLASTSDLWSQVVVDLSALLPLTSEMVLRFTAEDFQPPDTFVEAAVDNVEILDYPTDVREGIAPGAVGLTLAPPRPNPTVGPAVLEFETSLPGPATLQAYDVTGRRVATLLRASRLAAGRHRVNWDGSDAAGGRVAPGVYFLRLETPHGSAERKLVRVR
jgi:hypothetical protein